METANPPKHHAPDSPERSIQNHAGLKKMKATLRIDQRWPYICRVDEARLRDSSQRTSWPNGNRQEK